jgi:hypothetical protein
MQRCVVKAGIAIIQRFLKLSEATLGSFWTTGGELEDKG